MIDARERKALGKLVAVEEARWATKGIYAKQLPLLSLALKDMA